MARERTKRSIEAARQEFEAKKVEAEERERERLLEISEELELALKTVSSGVPDYELVSRLNVDALDPAFSKMDLIDIEGLLSNAEAAQTWTERVKSLYGETKNLAEAATSDPSQFAIDLKEQGLVLKGKIERGALHYFETASEKTGEIYDVIVGTDVCEKIEQINTEAIHFVGGAASGIAAAAKVARPSTTLLIIQQSAREIAVVKGVGIVERYASSGFFAAKVVPAIPSGMVSIAGASAVVYLGATGTCYVTSPEAKQHLHAVKSFSFSAIDTAKESAARVIDYVFD